MSESNITRWMDEFHRARKEESKAFCAQQALIAILDAAEEEDARED